MAAAAADEILINVSPGEVRAALVAEGRPLEFIIERPLRASVVGNVYLGRVLRIVPALDAAFVDIGLGRDGFLSGESARNLDPAVQEGLAPGRIADFLTEGEAIVVQAAKDAHGDKGVDLSTRLAFPGRLLVYAPFESAVRVSHRIEDEAERARLTEIVAGLLEAGEGAILRTASDGAEAAALAADVAHLRSLWSAVEASRDSESAPACLHAEPGPVPRILRDAAGPEIQRVVIDDDDALAEARRSAERQMPELVSRLARHQGPAPIFEHYQVEAEIERALRPRVRLPSGGEIVIEATEALTAIDVNTGGHTGRGRKADAALATNIEAAAEIARQLRLRNIGGRVVIDFVGMRDAANRARAVEALAAAVAGDRLPVRVGGMTEMGLVELTRKRERESLDGALREACDYCEGEKWIKTSLTVAFEVLRAVAREAAATPGRALAVVAAPDVITALEGEAGAARAELEESLGRKLVLRADEMAHRESFDIEPA